MNGPKQKTAARECGVGDRQFYKWSTGRTRTPKHKRQSVDRALGAKVDWEQYDRECDAQAMSAPVSAIAANPAPIPPEPANAPVAPVSLAQDEFEKHFGISVR